jgi:hypothetical protein
MNETRIETGPRGSTLLSHIKVNAATPGYTAIDLNAGKGDRTVEEGARAIVAMGTLDEDGPSGTFVNDAGSVPW